MLLVPAGGKVVQFYELYYEFECAAQMGIFEQSWSEIVYGLCTVVRNFGRILEINILL